jgi:hypothetical protein
MLGELLIVNLSRLVYDRDYLSREDLCRESILLRARGET